MLLYQVTAGGSLGSRLTWNVTPVESYSSAIERDSKAMENLKSGK